MEAKEATNFVYENLNSPNIQFWAFGYKIFKDNTEDKYVAIYDDGGYFNCSNVMTNIAECNLWLTNN